MKLSAGRVVAWGFVGWVLLGLLAPMIGMGVAIISAIAFGWFHFLQRTLPAITISWSGIGMVAMCSILILGGIHSFCGWLFSHAATTGNKGAVLKWRWSWTISLYLAVWLLFTAIMGAVGVAHQVGWLLRSDEPMLKRHKYVGQWRIYLREAGMILNFAAEESNWNLEATRREVFKTETSSGSRPKGIEDLHIILLSGTNGNLAAGIIFYRDPEARAKAGLVFVSPEVKGENRPIEDLPELLSRYQPSNATRPR